jgi:hypothetical protein
MATPILISTDTAPTISAVITNDQTAAPLDLSDCLVYFQLRLTNQRRFLINALCDITDATAGEVEYQLAAEDLDFDGECQARFLVIFPDLRKQHTTPAVLVTVEAQ